MKKAIVMAFALIATMACKKEMTPQNETQPNPQLSQASLIEYEYYYPDEDLELAIRGELLSLALRLG